MWNESIVIGYLGRDPDIRTTQNGAKIANMSVATSERWKSKDGEAQEKTEWHKVVAFGKLAEIAEKILKKGSLVAFRGTLRTRKWTDKNGNEKYTTEIALDGFEARLKLLAGGATAAEEKSAADKPRDDLDDDIPF